MKFENQLKEILSTDCNEINENEFISEVHKRRSHNNKKNQQLMQTIFAGAFIIMFGLITIESLEETPNSIDYIVTNTDTFTEIDTSAYLEDMALFLVDSGGDIYETVEFLYEMDLNILNQERDI